MTTLSAPRDPVLSSIFSFVGGEMVGGLVMIKEIVERAFF